MTNEAGAVLVVDVEELDGEFLLEVMRGQETPRVFAIRHAPVVELRGHQEGSGDAHGASSMKLLAPAPCSRCQALWHLPQSHRTSIGRS